ncbi:hypothetical protein K443DRAFT_98997 [Laccaria amethystina LaAM-08-1]|uniref:Unplaced genomic scaffold K443scaffold_75, whole genome shotgun sequence n=1 Tax=Laccaria amethystina LaAM-08-1 TaxID=1095629 RepID=A0A0C9WRI6_9AGAR|nr:hypothetical protein K443DRAFT_98997 [Laccaria amethystina LaAM-08-1]
MISPYVSSPPEFIHHLSNLLDYAISIRSSHVIVAVVPLLLTLAVFLLLRTIAEYFFGSPSRSSKFNSQVEHPAPPAVSTICVPPPPVNPHLLEIIFDSCRGDSDWFDRVRLGLAVQRQQAAYQGKVKMNIYLVNRRAGPAMTESYAALCGAWAVATGDPDHKDVTFEVKVDEEECLFRDEGRSVDKETCPTGSTNAPVQEFPPAEFLDVGEKPHITGFHWKGQLFALPETLRLPYLRHTPNLVTLSLTNCDIAVDDFIGILQHCPNLEIAEVNRINANIPILSTTLPRKIHSRFRHGLEQLTVTSAIDTHQLFDSLHLELSHLSLTLSSEQTVHDLNIGWIGLEWLYLNCWLSPSELMAVHSKIHKNTKFDICRTTIPKPVSRNLFTTGGSGIIRLA